MKARANNAALIVIAGLVGLVALLAMPFGLGRVIGDLWVSTMTLVVTLIARLFGA